MNRSEIILNPDGSIYHLQLKNGDIASTVITVGDPGRVEEVISHFDQVFSRYQNREFLTVTGRIGTKDISVISTGIGTDNVDVVLNELQLVHSFDLERRQLKEQRAPLEIIRLGTSGAIHTDIELDSILISEAALSFDGLLPFYDHEFEEVNVGLSGIPNPSFVPASPDLLRQFSAMADYTGLTITAAGFYAPQGRNVIAPPRHLNFLTHLASLRVNGLRPTNLEMETAGIYGLGHLLGMKCLSISAILANRIDGTFSQQPQATVGKMINEALEIISAPR